MELLGPPSDPIRSKPEEGRTSIVRLSGALAIVSLLLGSVALSVGANTTPSLIGVAIPLVAAAVGFALVHLRFGQDSDGPSAPHSTFTRRLAAVGLGGAFYAAVVTPLLFRLDAAGAIGIALAIVDYALIILTIPVCLFVRWRARRDSDLIAQRMGALGLWMGGLLVVLVISTVILLILSAARFDEAQVEPALAMATTALLGSQPESVATMVG